MSLRHPKVTENRDDISRFMVHFTRDDREDYPGGGGGTARENFLKIFTTRRIKAIRPHCLHADKLPDERISDFKVCCFTETPLRQLHHITKLINNRSIKLKPYGFVFSRRMLIERGAQPVRYVNNYGDNSEERASYDDLFRESLVTKFRHPRSGLLKYVSVMNERCDFAWEKEWRLSANLTFDYASLSFAVLPKCGAEDLHEMMAKKGIPVLTTGLTYEGVVEALALQLRRQADKVKAKSAAIKKLKNGGA